MTAKTVIIQIGNSDDKLTQREWANFVEETGRVLFGRTGQIHFFGCSHPSAQWQNAAWVATIDDESLKSLRNALSDTAKTFRQDSIALTVGETEFVTP